MNEHVKSNASRYGLIVGAISVVYTLFLYLIDMESMTNMWAGITLWLVGVIILIMAVSKTKKDQQGYISFKEGFSTFIIAYIISALISTLFTIILFSLIDPEAGRRLQEIAIQTLVENLEKFGASEEQIEAQVEAMEATNPYGAVSLIKSFFFQIVGYAILGLIVAAIMKKNRPTFIEEPSED